MQDTTKLMPPLQKPNQTLLWPQFVEGKMAMKLIRITMYYLCLFIKLVLYRHVCIVFFPN